MREADRAGERCSQHQSTINATTTMSRSRLPPEISDCVVDLLHDEREGLKKCCLVSKLWVARARKHLFNRVAFRSLDDLNTWKQTFPDPGNSPAYYTHSLVINYRRAISAAVVEEAGWIRAFSNVVRLEVRGTSCLRFYFLP
jgi:hypothetical protein